MPNEDKERIAGKQLARIKEKIRVIKTGTGTPDAHDPKHYKDDPKHYKGSHRKSI